MRFVSGKRGRDLYLGSVDEVRIREGTGQIRGKEESYMEIRTATMEDLEAITAVEEVCFPPAEAATRESFERRLAVFPNHFWLLWDGDKLVALINGLVTDIQTLSDEMFVDASMHDEAGAWQMIFGVETIPEYRNQGCAGTLMRRVISDAKMQGRKGLVLTCKEKLIPYYAKFGFVNEGISASVHGGAVWYDMRLTLS